MLTEDRQKVVDKIQALERAGNFFEDVEDDPATRVLMPDEVDYSRKKISSKIKTKLTYMIARRFLNKMLKNEQIIIDEIKGIEHFQALHSGAVITCNHFNAFDSFAIQMTYDASHHKKRKFYRVIREGNYTNFPGFYGKLMRHCQTLPLSSHPKTMQNFLNAVDTLLKAGHFILLYPEQSMWWNYRKPKPFKKTAFKFAAQAQVPVLPCFITMRDTNKLAEDGSFIQAYTIHVSAPIYPDETYNVATNTQRMMEKNSLLWKTIYEDTYGIPLVYEKA